MADRSLRGMRLGFQSMQSEEGVEFSPRKRAVYRTVEGVDFEVMFSADADIPETWESPRSGQAGRLVGDDGEIVPDTSAAGKPPRTHWDMLLERRTIPELEELLEERLQYLRARRGKAAVAASKKSA